MAVIAARPSHGKTAFGLHWIDAAAANQIPCLIVSEEMSKLELAKRALLAISKLDSEKWEIGKKTQLEKETNSHYDQRAPVYGIESCQTVDALEQAVAMHVEVKGVRLVAVDYLQLLSSEHNVSRYEAVTDISKRLKQIAVKYRVAMLVMCQLNREIEKRDRKMPQLSDLRESGQIEQDADLVLFLQWPCRMGGAEENDKRYWIWCAKRRNGPIRLPKVETEFDCERQKFGRHETDMDCELDPQDYADRYGGGR
jgi:replicative DNA helicase